MSKTTLYDRLTARLSSVEDETKWWTVNEQGERVKKRHASEAGGREEPTPEEFDEMDDLMTEEELRIIVRSLRRENADLRARLASRHAGERLAEAPDALEGLAVDFAEIADLLDRLAYYERIKAGSCNPGGPAYTAFVESAERATAAASALRVQKRSA